MKKNALLAPKPFRLTDTPGTGNDLTAFTWKGKLPKESDRNHVPFFPTAGLARVVNGNVGGEPPDGGGGHLGTTRVIEPTPVWGKQGTTFKIPRAVYVIGNQSNDGGLTLGTSTYDLLAGDAAFLAKLSAAGVVLAETAGSNNTDRGFLLGYFPADSTGAVQTEWDGGDLYILTLGPILNEGASTGPAYLYDTSGAPTWALTPGGWYADLTTLTGLLPKFHKFGFRNYLTISNVSGLASFSAAMTQADADLAGIGVPGFFGGVDFTTDLLGKIETDIKTFFGIM